MLRKQPDFGKIEDFCQQSSVNFGADQLYHTCQIVTNTVWDFITGIYWIFRRRQSLEYRQFIAVVLII